MPNSVVHGLQRNIVHCTILLTLLNCHTHYDVCSSQSVLNVTSLWRQSLFTSRYIQCIAIDKGS